MQETLFSVEPWGDDRDDLRAAWNTLAIVTALTPGETSVTDRQAMLDNLQAYLKINTRPEVVLTPEQAAAAMGG